MVMGGMDMVLAHLYARMAMSNGMTREQHRS
jgi:hypothetical protein